MWLAAREVDKPKYQQIAADLADQIHGGEYLPGDLLPTHAQLGERYAVSLITVRQAVRLLAEQGLVKTVPGKGTIATSGASSETLRIDERVGVLLPNVAAWYALHPALFEELHDLRHEILMKPLPVGTDFDAQPDRALFELKALRSTCGGGLIIFGDRFLVETFLRERRRDEVGVCLENSNGIPPTLPMLSTDNFGGTFALTRHLLRLGHRRLAYLDWLLLRSPDPNRMREGTTHERRFAGFRAALRAAGLTPCMPHDFLESLLYSADSEELMRLFRRPAMPTAIVCFNDTIADEAQARLAAAGIAVPGQVSLAGYDNVSKLGGGNWLTTLDQNGPELARHLVRLLHEERERLQHRREEAAARILVPPVLHIRDSVAPPPV